MRAEICAAAFGIANPTLFQRGLEGSPATVALLREQTVCCAFELELGRRKGAGCAPLRQRFAESWNGCSGGRANGGAMVVDLPFQPREPRGITWAKLQQAGALTHGLLIAQRGFAVARHEAKR